MAPIPLAPGRPACTARTTARAARRAAHRSRRQAVAALLGSAALGATLLAAPAPASATSCAVTWGSLPKSVGTLSTGPLTGVRTGQHACYDRLVVDHGPGAAPGYTVSYVSHITADGSGDIIPTRGGAALQVVVNAPAYDDAGRATFAPGNPAEVAAVGGYRTFRQLVWGFSFEGYSTVGLGVRARLPFRVFTLPSTGGGSRLVVDVAHTW
jgi:hypothetical protein